MTENNTLDTLRNILAKDLPRTRKAEHIAQTIRELDVESERPQAFSPESQTALEEVARMLVPFWINSS
jgi:hypothetical protein